MKRNVGYMLVRYSGYYNPETYNNELVKASGRRIYYRDNYVDVKAKLKQGIEEIKSNSNFSITKKDERKGYVCYQTNGCKMMLAIMPFSGKIILPVELY